MKLINLMLNIMFFVACIGLLWSLTFSPPASECKKKGGTYFLNGECVKIKMEPIQ